MRLQCDLHHRHFEAHAKFVDEEYVKIIDYYASCSLP